MGRFAYRDFQPKVTKTTTLDDGIETINLEGLDFITQLNINAKAMAADGTYMGTPIHKVITKIEVVANGSSVIKSYNAQHLRAIAAYSGIDLSVLGDYSRHGTDDKCFWSFPILFGRYPGDPKYMLDTSHWETLQAKLHWNAATTSHDGGTYEATADPNFCYSADALVYEKGVPPGCEGYIKSMQINEYTLTASTSAEYTSEVPRGHPLRGIQVRSVYEDDQWYYPYQNMKLDFDNGKWIPLDVEDRQLNSLFSLWWPKVWHFSEYADWDSAMDWDAGFGVIKGFSGCIGQTTDIAMGLNHGPTFGQTEVIALNATGSESETPRGYIAMTHGIMPQHCLYIPMWKFADIDEDGVPTEGYKRIDFSHTTDTNVAAAKTNVVAEYLVPNGQV